MKQRFIASHHIYPLAAHEFGHILGLPDEYHQSAKQQNADQANLNEYTSLCAKFQVTKPALNTTSMSLMAAGNQLLPAHYVTLANAVHQHLMIFYKQVNLNNRLRRGRPTNASPPTAQELQVAFNNMEAQKPWDDYAITIGQMRRTTTAGMVPLQRYIPLEAALSLPADIKGSGSFGL
jgi:hypothetical protein